MGLPITELSCQSLPRRQSLCRQNAGAFSSESESTEPLMPVTVKITQAQCKWQVRAETL